MINRNLNRRICSLHLKLLEAKFVPIDSITPLKTPPNQQSTLLKNSERKKSNPSTTFECSHSSKSLYRKLRTNCKTLQNKLPVNSEDPSKILEYLDVSCTEVYKEVRENSRKERATTKQKLMLDPQLLKEKKLIKNLQHQNKLVQKQVTKICTNMSNWNAKKVKNIKEIRIFHEEQKSLENSKIFLCDDLEKLMTIQDNSQNNHEEPQSKFAKDMKNMKILKKQPKLLKMPSYVGSNLNQPDQCLKNKNSNSFQEIPMKKAYQYQRNVKLNQFESLYEKIQKHKEAIKSGQTTVRQKSSQIMDKREMTQEFIRKIPKSLGKKLQHFFGSSKQMRLSQLVKNLR